MAEANSLSLLQQVAEANLLLTTSGRSRSPPPHNKWPKPILSSQQQVAEASPPLSYTNKWPKPLPPFHQQVAEANLLLLLTTSGRSQSSPLPYTKWPKPLSPLTPASGRSPTSLLQQQVAKAQHPPPTTSGRSPTPSSQQQVAEANPLPPSPTSGRSRSSHPQNNKWPKPPPPFPYTRKWPKPLLSSPQQQVAEASTLLTTPSGRSPTHSPTSHRRLQVAEALADPPQHHPSSGEGCAS